MTTNRTVVLWSGGADSTLLLHQYAGVSSEDYPVVALSVIGHPNLNKHQISAQNAAQQRYLKFAKKKGYHIDHQTVITSGKFVWGGDHDGNAQPVVWLGALAQIVGKNDIVLMGYIRDASFWHFNHEFKEAFRTMCGLKGLEAKLSFPLEYHHKWEVMQDLKSEKIPDNCWFSCDGTANKKPCGSCSKCKEIEDAKKELLARKQALKQLAPVVTKKRRRK